MLYYVLVFCAIALVAGALGFTGIAVGAIEIAQILFVVFLAVVALTLLIGPWRRPME